MVYFLPKILTVLLGIGFIMNFKAQWINTYILKKNGVAISLSSERFLYQKEISS